MNIPSIKMPTVRHAWQLIQQGDYGFLLISRLFIYTFLLLSVSLFFFLDFVWHTLSVKSFAIWADHGLKYFHFTF